MPAKKPITPGDRFGRLTVVSEISRHRTSGGNVQRRFLCRCDCGEERLIVAGSLRDGQRSCGCLKADVIRRRCTKHGYAGTRLYLIWNNMWRRCTEPTNDRYAQYGGRGIRVCERWKKFESFLADMGEPPAGMTLDRYPDNDGNYEPANCRWATAKEQANNKQSSNPIVIDGVTRPITEWISLLGVNRSTIYRRIHRGMDARSALLAKDGRR